MDLSMPMQNQRPTDPRTGRFVKKPVRLCVICSAPARPIKHYKHSGPCLCDKHHKEWDRRYHLKYQENRRKTKRVLWAFGLEGGEYTYCPYVHPTWPEHKELRRWKGWRLYWSKRNKKYYRDRAFEWAEKGLIDLSPEQLHNLITSSSTTNPRR